MEVGAIVGGTSLGENKLWKTSDLILRGLGFVDMMINYSITIIIIIPVVNILSLFDSNFSCCLICMIDCLMTINRLKFVLNEIIFYCEL